MPDKIVNKTDLIILLTIFAILFILVVICFCYNAFLSKRKIETVDNITDSSNRISNIHSDENSSNLNDTSELEIKEEIKKPVESEEEIKEIFDDNSNKSTYYDQIDSVGEYKPYEQDNLLTKGFESNLGVTLDEYKDLMKKEYMHPMFWAPYMIVGAE